MEKRDAPEPVVLRSAALGETMALGARIADAVSAGDLIAVSGPLGAGKSELCRAIVRRLMDNPELEVPSPSYTLVNVFEAPGFEIWHADLYRVGDESELLEIGLEDAVAHSVILVEWPERWPDLPMRRLEISLQPEEDESRLISVRPHGDWSAMLVQLGAPS
ncbi:MAG: tRNA (adenosine(37)-N6)-threonylcarbamoyltransferase complex ATPase subunit type 1 TsaE [Pseudomonadota bacterium]